MYSRLPRTAKPRSPHLAQQARHAGGGVRLLLLVPQRHHRAPLHQPQPIGQVALAAQVVAWPAGGDGKRGSEGLQSEW